jgi:hypothetical protein
MLSSTSRATSSPRKPGNREKNREASADRAVTARTVEAETEKIAEKGDSPVSPENAESLESLARTVLQDVNTTVKVNAAVREEEEETTEIDHD